MRKMVNSISFRVTPAELVSLEELAKQKGTNLSDCVRSILITEIEHQQVSSIRISSRDPGEAHQSIAPQFERVKRALDQAYLALASMDYSGLYTRVKNSLDDIHEQLPEQKE